MKDQRGSRGIAVLFDLHIRWGGGGGDWGGVKIFLKNYFKKNRL